MKKIIIYDARPMTFIGLQAAETGKPDSATGGLCWILDVLTELLDFRRWNLRFESMRGR